MSLCIEESNIISKLILSGFDGEEYEACVIVVGLKNVEKMVP